jgi:two-component system LytT family sensor kinase
LVSLEEELQIVYLAIEAQRLGGKLKVEMQVADDLLRELIPVLSIEPLVENAVKHGVAAAREGGTVYIEVARAGDEMVIAVSDTGHGDEEAGPSGTGVGLENVSRRLQLCFGPDARVSLERSVGMTRVSFRAPCNRLVAASTR